MQAEIGLIYVWSGSVSMFLKLALKLIDTAAQECVGFTLFRNALFRMQYIGMGASEKFADFVAGKAGELSAQIHRHHPRIGDLAGTALAEHIVQGDAEMIGNKLLDRFRTDIACLTFSSQLGVEQFFRLRNGYVIGPAHFRISGQSEEAPFESAHRTGDIFRKKIKQFVGK